MFYGKGMLKSPQRGSANNPATYKLNQQSQLKVKATVLTGDDPSNEMCDEPIATLQTLMMDPCACKLRLFCAEACVDSGGNVFAVSS